MDIRQEQQLLRIGRAVANKSRIVDKDEAFSVALVGIARGLNTYKPNKNTKLDTYLYRCGQIECWAEWRKNNRIKRGKGCIELSIEDMMDKGFEFSDNENKII